MLTPEEKFLWRCARTWRRPAVQQLDGDLDWETVVSLAVDNGLATLLQDIMEKTGRAERLPSPAKRALSREVALYNYRARLFSRELRKFLNLAAERNLDVVVIKGLWLSLKIYGRADARPGADVDLLLRRADVRTALNVLEYGMGYGRWWRPLLDDVYYARHHLHQQRCNPGRAVWFEPHWRLDHPYTQLTIDYEAMMDRTTRGTLLGEEVRELAPPDLLLSLVVHLVKHAVYLPTALQRADLPRLILADGMLTYFLDVSEVLKTYEEELAWAEVTALAQRSGATTLMGAVLRVCAQYLEAPVPGEALAALPVRSPGGVTGRLKQGLADYVVEGDTGTNLPRLWRFLSGFKESMVFRPIRLLDVAHYCAPDAGYLRRRYGRATILTAAFHFLHALGQYARIGLDTVTYTWQRRRRLQRMNPQELDRCDARYDPLLAAGPGSPFEADETGSERT